MVTDIKNDEYYKENGIIYLLFRPSSKYNPTFILRKIIFTNVIENNRTIQIFNLSPSDFISNYFHVRCSKNVGITISSDSGSIQAGNIHSQFLHFGNFGALCMLIKLNSYSQSISNLAILNDFYKKGRHNNRLKSINQKMVFSSTGVIFVKQT